MKGFGANLKHYRKRQGLSQEELATLLDVKKTTVSYYEIGRREPSLKRLRVIADALGITPNDLLSTDDTPTETPNVKHLVLNLDDHNAVDITVKHIKLSKEGT